MNFIYTEMMKISDILTSIKMWISLRIPEIANGNNFGVSVQQEYIGQLNRMEESLSSLLSYSISYYNDRSELVETVYFKVSFQIDCSVP